MSNLTGRLLVGRYRLGHVVDEAALCTTYQAYDVETKEEVAIEVLTRPTGAGLPSAKALRREARRIVDAAHRNLRAARTIGVEGGVPFIVSAALVGESLRDRLTRSGPLPVVDAVEIARQIIDALTAAHAAGLVHGNLKPEKIRLVAGPTGTPIATLMGLGVTAILGTMRDVDARGLGTPPYLAPEQLDAEAAAPADELTDAWGVGVLLFEMLTGRRAFDGTSAEEISRRISSAGMVRLRHLRREVPLALERIVSATLTKSRQQRLSLLDLRRALRDDVRPEPEAVSAPKSPAAAAAVIVDCSDPCDVEGTTDLLVHVETDLGSL